MAGHRSPKPFARRARSRWQSGLRDDRGGRPPTFPSDHRRERLAPQEGAKALPAGAICKNGKRGGAPFEDRSRPGGPCLIRSILTDPAAVVVWALGIGGCSPERNRRRDPRARAPRPQSRIALRAPRGQGHSESGKVRGLGPRHEHALRDGLVAVLPDGDHLHLVLRLRIEEFLRHMQARGVG